MRLGRAGAWNPLSDLRRPCLSVVVAATDSAEAVAGCLASLDLARAGLPVEVVVAAPWDRAACGPVPEGVRWIAAEQGVAIGTLRRQAANQASADVIAFTEDSCRLEPGWIRAWLQAFRDPRLLAATGPVEQFPAGSALDWAVYFCEYASFTGPCRGGPVRRLAGNNFALRRRVLDVLPVSSEIGECQVAGLLARRAGALAAVPEARAWHVGSYTLREAIFDRLRFGYRYGCGQSAGPFSGRLAHVALGPGILAIQVGRLLATLLVRRRHGGRFLDGLPLTAALLAAWSVGEWLGWLRGPALPGACKSHETAGPPRCRATGPRPSRPAGYRASPVAASAD